MMRPQSSTIQMLQHLDEAGLDIELEMAALDAVGEGEGITLRCEMMG